MVCTAVLGDWEGRGIWRGGEGRGGEYELHSSINQVTR